MQDTPTLGLSSAGGPPLAPPNWYCASGFAADLLTTSVRIMHHESSLHAQQRQWLPAACCQALAQLACCACQAAALHCRAPACMHWLLRRQAVAPHSMLPAGIDRPALQVTVITDQTTQLAVPSGVQLFRFPINKTLLGRNAWANYFQYQVRPRCRAGTDNTPSAPAPFKGPALASWAAFLSGLVEAASTD